MTVPTDGRLIDDDHRRTRTTTPPRLVFADWLDGEGRHGRGGYIRVEVEPWPAATRATVPESVARGVIVPPLTGLLSYSGIWRIDRSAVATGPGARPRS